MKRSPRIAIGCSFSAGFAAAFIAGACGSNPPPPRSGDFSGPSGLAITSARDRDVLFIANSGSNELRALGICTTPSGSPTPGTCLAREDFKFVPGPVRLFPGSQPVGERPLRLAGVRMKAADGSNAGAVLVVGADATLRTVDPVNVIDVMKRAAPGHPPHTLPLDSPAVDVVGEVKIDPETGRESQFSDTCATSGPPTLCPGQSARAFAALATASGGTLLALQVKLLAAGDICPVPVAAGDTCPVPVGAPYTTVAARCALVDEKLRDVVPARLALIPGRIDRIYVSDGSPADRSDPVRGTGALELDVTGLTAVDPTSRCTVRRRLPQARPGETLSPGKQLFPLGAIALSPAFKVPQPSLPDGTPVQPKAYPAGALLFGVIRPPPAGRTRFEARGGLVFIRTGISDARIPQPLPADLDDADNPAAPNPMAPLQLTSPIREVAFLTPPAPDKCPAGVDPNECLFIQVGGAGGIAPLSIRKVLAAVVTSDDGSVTFVDPLKRRFINDARDAIVGSAGAQPSIEIQLTPLPAANAQSPRLAFPDNKTPAPTSDPNKQNPGWVNAGVTPGARWQIVWHAPFPGLETLAGTLGPSSVAGRVRFNTLPGSFSLQPWIDSPKLNLRAGDPVTRPGDADAVAFASVTTPSGGSPCDSLAGLAGLEFAITSISSTSFDLDLNVPPTCFGSTVNAVVQVRAAGNAGGGPWLVFQDADAVGRAPHAPADPTKFFAQRFDYPLDSYTTAAPPLGADIAVAFTLSGPQPTLPGTFWSFITRSGQVPTAARDGSAPQGFAGPVLVYNSPKFADLIFASVAGSNSVLQITPALMATPTGGIIAYR